MDYNLEMLFTTEAGGTKVITITEPKTDLTLQDVQPVMETILANQIFILTSPLKAILEARYVQKQTTVLA